MSTIDRSGCSAPRHGTRTAYAHDGCRCPDALQQGRKYANQRRRARTPSGYVSPIPSARKVQALMALGWPAYEIARRLGWGHANTNFQRLSRIRRMYRSHAEALERVYRELSGTSGPSETTRRRAAAAGYLPPLAWDNINTDEHPPATSGNDGDIDEIAVVRAINGHPPTKLRRPDRLAAIAELAADGIPSTEIAGRLKVGVDRVRTDRNTMGNQRRRARREAGEAS